MGHISEYKKTVNTNVDKDIFLALYNQTKQDCIDLIECSYEHYLADTEKIFIADEIVITAGIYDKRSLSYFSNEYVLSPHGLGRIPCNP